MAVCSWIAGERGGVQGGGKHQAAVGVGIDPPHQIVEVFVSGGLGQGGMELAVQKHKPPLRQQPGKPNQRCLGAVLLFRKHALPEKHLPMDTP